MYQSLEIESERRPSGQDEEISSNKMRKMKMVSLWTVVIATLLIVGAALSPASRKPTEAFLVIEAKDADIHKGDYFDGAQMNIVPLGDQAGWPRAVCGGGYTRSKVAGRVFLFHFRTPSSSTFTNVVLSTCDATRPLDTWLYLYRPTSRGFQRVWNCDDCDGSCQRQTVQSFTIGSTQNLQSGRTTRIQFLQQSTDYVIGIGAYRGAPGAFSLRVTCTGGGGSPTTSTTTTQSPPATTRTTTSQQPQSTVSTPTNNCPVPRVRRPWRSLSDQEKNLYINGYLELRENGVLTSFRNEHRAGASIGHGNILFLPWHRQFILELEEQIRLLGGPFSCFVLPYWDWTYVMDSSTPITQLAMWNELGGLGRAANRGAFQNYRDSDGGFLRRVMNDWTSLQDSSVFLTSMLDTNMGYRTFRYNLEGGQHGAAHVTVDSGQLNRVPTATDDPVFFMLHAMVDMVWLLRQECYANRLNEVDYPWSGLGNRNRVMSFATLSQDDRLSTGSMRPINVFDSVNSLGVNYDATALLQRARSQGVNFGSCQGSRFVVDDGVYGRKTSYSHDADKKAAYKTCKATSGVCGYTEPLETCVGQDYSLQTLLNKRGVRSNPCISRRRKRAYNFYKSAGMLRGLCDGMADNVCDYI